MIPSEVLLPTLSQLKDSTETPNMLDKVQSLPIEELCNVLHMQLTQKCGGGNSKAWAIVANIITGMCLISLFIGLPYLFIQNSRSRKAYTLMSKIYLG